MSRAVVNRPCPNAQSAMWGKLGKGNIRLHDFLKLKRGPRPRYRRMSGQPHERLPRAFT